MDIFRFYSQGSPVFFCSENIVYKPLQKWMRPVSQIQVQGASWVLKKGRNPLGAGLTSPLSPTHSPMSGLCDYMAWKGLEHLCPLALVCATCGFVGLGKYLWKCFCRNKLFELWGDSQGWQHCEFLNWILSPSPLSLWEMCVDIGHCGSDPWSAEQRAQETESRKDDSLPALNPLGPHCPFLDPSTCSYAPNDGTGLHLLPWRIS